MKPYQTSRFFSWISISCLLLQAAILYADPWPVAEPESAGFQKDKLEKVAEYAKENGMFIIYEEELKGGEENRE